MELWREGKVVTVQVAVGHLDESELQVASATPAPDEPIAEDVPALGLTLSTITPQLRTKFDLEDSAGGVMVIRVEGNGLAAEKGIRPGDVIVEVGQEEVSSPADVIAKIEAQKAQNKKSVLLLVDRKGDFRFVAVRLSDS